MKTIMLITIICVCTFQLIAQSKCDDIVALADDAAKKGQYQDAILKYNAAKTCDPTLAKKVDEKIMLVFAEIAKLQKKAFTEMLFYPQSYQVPTIETCCQDNGTADYEIGS